MATSFKQMATMDPNTIMVVDSLNLAFRYAHKRQATFLDDYVRTVESLKKSYKAGKVIITCDKGSSSYRKALLPEYKSGRKAKQEEQTPEDAEYYEVFFKEFDRIIETYKELEDYPVFRFDRCEADDVAAYIVRKCRNTHKIWLVSSDKDWDLLISDNVSRFSYVTTKETTIDNWGDHYDYPVDDHISVKCLMGDSGDSVPGVKGIGPKKAQALVQEFGSTYDIIASLPISSKYKYVAALNEFGAERLILNYKLMDLVSHCDEALGKDNCKIIDEVLCTYLK